MEARHSLPTTSQGEGMAENVFCGDGENIQGTSVETNGVGPVKKNKFQQVVRRHIGKDRLFHLVTTLMKSIEEEKRAHRDLILSFETARNIKIDIPKPKRSANELKPKRRRKKLDLPLIDKIKAERKASIESIDSETNHLSNEDPLHNAYVDNNFHGLFTKQSSESASNVIGQLEIEAVKDQQTQSVSHKAIGGKENEERKGTDFRSGTEGKLKVCEEESTSSDPDPDQSTNVNIHGIKSSSVQRFASSAEKATVIDHFREIDDNFDLDKIVLDSVLQNTYLGVLGDEEKGPEKDNDKTLVPDIDHESDSAKTVDSVIKQHIIVEVESDFSDEESRVAIDGLADDNDTNSILLDSTSRDQCKRTNSKCKKLSTRLRNRGKDQFSSLTTTEVNRTPTTLHKTCIRKISEAASFGSLYDKTSDSIIEIETDKSSVDKLNKPPQNILSSRTNINESYIEKNVLKKSSMDLTPLIEKQEEKVEERHTITNESSKPKVLCIDLFGVYEGNKDLQRINLRQSSTNRRIDNLSPNKGFYPANKARLSFRRWKRKHQNQLLGPKALSFKSNSVKFKRPDPNTRSSDESSLPSFNEQFRNIMVEKDFQRYTKPDMILWTTLNVYQGKEKHDSIQYREINESRKLPCLPKPLNGKPLNGKLHVMNKDEREFDFTSRELRLRNVMRKASLSPESYNKDASCNMASVKRLHNVGCRYI